MFLGLCLSPSVTASSAISPSAPPCVILVYLPLLRRTTVILSDPVFKELTVVDDICENPLSNRNAIQSAPNKDGAGRASSTGLTSSSQPCPGWVPSRSLWAPTKMASESMPTAMPALSLPTSLIPDHLKISVSTACYWTWLPRVTFPLFWAIQVHIVCTLQLSLFWEAADLLPSPLSQGAAPSSRQSQVKELTSSPSCHTAGRKEPGC